MKKVYFTILGCAVCLSLFSGCIENNCDDCCCTNKEDTVALKSCAKTEKNINIIKEEVKMITTNSGLKYEVLAEGKDSQTPNTGQKVTVHYTGWLDDNGKKGTKFDSSVDRGTPFTFTIGV